MYIHFLNKREDIAFKTFNLMKNKSYKVYY